MNIKNLIDDENLVESSILTSKSMVPEIGYFLPMESSSFYLCSNLLLSPFFWTLCHK